MGREALAWLRDARPDVDPVAFFTADSRERPGGEDVGLPVVDTLAALQDVGVGSIVLGIGANALRRKVRNEVMSAGFEILSVLHPSVFYGPGVTFGAGCLVAPGVILTRDIQVGDGAIVNYGAKVGHDCSIGEHVFLGPGAILTGDVFVDLDVMVGAGAVVLPGVRIAAGSTVGAGAVVTADVPERTTVVGVPARPLSSV
jgi:sugar O-acyltransferase (sialic acid O-acetyltransferase NeuD family)